MVKPYVPKNYEERKRAAMAVPVPAVKPTVTVTEHKSGTARLVKLTVELSMTRTYDYNSIRCGASAEFEIPVNADRTATIKRVQSYISQQVTAEAVRQFDQMVVRTRDEKAQLNQERQLLAEQERLATQERRVKILQDRQRQTYPRG